MSDTIIELEKRPAPVPIFSLTPKHLPEVLSIAIREQQVRLLLSGAGLSVESVAVFVD